MTASIYKYLGPANVDHVLGPADQIMLRCSYPEAFNDPYELFLTIDFGDRPEVLAFYAEAVGDLPQLPTTCFSRSPAVIPMWAHYAAEMQGYAIELNESTLSEAFPESGFGDVDYRDVPDPALVDMLYRASEIGKPRYVYLLHRGVFSAAYYTKASCWSYEQERRMIVGANETRRKQDLMLIDVPAECVTALITGPRASEETIRAVRHKADQLGCRYFELKIGRSSAVPYFVDPSGDPFTFTGDDIQPSLASCASCGEPIPGESDQCSWCQIDEALETEAAARNPYRLLDHFGMLESYVRDMEDITRRGRDQ